MKDSLISIIIPVYNVEKYLRQCLDSVLAQTYTNYEVIMVDDGSTDSSGDICEEYSAKEARFKVIHKKNGGLSVARNTGFEASKGEYIYFMDSDDWIVAETISSLVEKAKTTNADFVFFDGKSFEDSDKGYYIKQGYKRKKEYSTGSGIEVFDALQKNGDFKSAIPTYLWKKEFLDSAHLSFYPGILYEDMIYSFEAFCKAQIVAHCHKEFYQRRIRPGSIVTSGLTSKNFQCSCIVYREATRIADDNLLMDRPSVNKYIIRCAMRPLDIYDGMLSAERQKCKEIYKQVVSEIRTAKGYGNKPLYYRTYGKIPWAVSKSIEKITGR